MMEKLEIISTAIMVGKEKINFHIEMSVTEEPSYSAAFRYLGKEYKFPLIYDVSTLEFKVDDAGKCPKEIRDVQHFLSIAIEHHHL